MRLLIFGKRTQPSGNELQRVEECRPLNRNPTDDDLFFCGLGTLWCTEGHGDLKYQGRYDLVSEEA